MGPALCFAAVFVVLEFGHPADQRWRLTRGRLLALGWISGMLLLALVLALQEGRP